MRFDAFDGYQLVDGPLYRSTVLGNFTEALLTSLSDLLLISSITLPIPHRCLGALSSCINTASLTLIYGQLLFKGLNFLYSRARACVCACVCVCVCVCVYSSSIFCKCPRHTWGYGSTILCCDFSWVLSAKFHHLRIWKCHISPQKTKTPVCNLLERKRYYIMCSAKGWYIYIYWYRI